MVVTFGAHVRLAFKEDLFALQQALGNIQACQVGFAYPCIHANTLQHALSAVRQEEQDEADRHIPGVPV